MQRMRRGQENKTETYLFCSRAHRSNVRADHVNPIVTFCIAGDSCFGFTEDKTSLVLEKDLSEDVLAKANGDLIVIIEVEFRFE